MLLLHGNPTWAFLYRDFVGPLTEAGYRVIAPDCIGAGYSDKPRIDAAYSLAHHIADLVSLIDQLDLTGFGDRRPGLGRPAGRRRGAAAPRPRCGAHADEHLALHRLQGPLPHLAAALDHLARADHRAVLHEAAQGALARRAVGHEPRAA